MATLQQHACAAVVPGGPPYGWFECRPTLRLPFNLGLSFDCLGCRLPFGYLKCRPALRLPLNLGLPVGCLGWISCAVRPPSPIGTWGQYSPQHGHLEPPGRDTICTAGRLLPVLMHGSYAERAGYIGEPTQGSAKIAGERPFRCRWR